LDILLKICYLHLKIAKDVVAFVACKSWDPTKKKMKSQIQFLSFLLKMAGSVLCMWLSYFFHY